MSALVLLSSPSAARAAEPGRAPALCTFDLHETVSPGRLITPSQGTGHGVGTITCLGALDGKRLTGDPGQFEWWLTYGSSDVPVGGNTCVLGGGKGTWEVSLPTVDGSALALTGPWQTMGTFAGEIHGQLGRHAVEMVYEGYGERLGENCVTKPASHFRVFGQGTVG